jgi:ribosome-associated translation inhibitor RaiA
MTLPVDVTFRNLQTSEWLESEIRKRAAKLQTYCADAVACRVLVEVPHRHHEHGNRFHVRITIAVPGEEIAVSHAPSLHATGRNGEARRGKGSEIAGMRKDALLVVREAFAAARRQLQDYARRRRLAVKTHRTPARAIARA